MKRLVSLSLLGLMVLASNHALADRLAVTPGNWEFEIEYDLIGVPQSCKA